ncbi:MAG: Ppx/GppA phosphatase family protein [Clostridia bacterium]
MERIALIDLGSNTTRLTIYDVYDGGYFAVVNEAQEKAKLGEIEKEGNLKQTRILQAIAIIKSFKKICLAYKVDKTIAIATAAVRCAKNQKAFLNDVFSATGVKFKVLSEEEEAMHDYHGVVNSIEIPKGVIFEIGGGSIKLIQYNRRTVVQKMVLNFGAVTLRDMFFNSNSTPEESCDKIEDYVSEQLNNIDWLKNLEPEYKLIGVGGSIRSLARIARKIKRYPLEMVHNYHIDYPDFEYIYNMIRPFDLEKASKIKGLGQSRADVFPCAMAALKSLMKICNFDQIACCSCGIRDGIMFNYACPSTLDKPIVDIVGYSLHSKIRQWNLNNTHAEQTFNLCVQLFKQLRVLHKFPRYYVRVLRVASMLYEAGRAIKFYDYAKHTAYMILKSNLYGVPHQDIALAAYICDIYTKEDNASSDWQRFSSILTPEDFDAAKKLAVILQLAVAFDSSLSNAVTEINCDVLGDSVIMKTEIEGDASIEIKEATKMAIEFKKVFKKNLEIL